MRRTPCRIVFCRPKAHSCPRCGVRGCRKRLLVRVIRSLAWRQAAYAEVRYAEYRSRCESPSAPGPSAPGPRAAPRRPTTLLLATDPIADEIVGFALVTANGQDHMRRFLLGLR